MMRTRATECISSKGYIGVGATRWVALRMGIGRPVKRATHRVAPTMVGIVSLAILLLAEPAMAQTSGMQGDLAVGLGYNQGTENEADESFCLSVKERLPKWEYGLDLCMSEDRGGVGDNNFAFVWGGWINDFHRQDFQDYGIFAGVGAGVFVLQDELVDWPAGPFVIIGWDLSTQAGLEGKLGYFGENLWGTAVLYWYFK